MPWLASVISSFFGAIMEGLRAALSERRRDESFRRMGEAEAAARAAQESAAAQERMRDAGAVLRDRKAAQDRLMGGSA